METMESFAQGFFGRNAESQYSLELEVEGSLNATSGELEPLLADHPRLIRGSNQLRSAPKAPPMPFRPRPRSNGS